MKLSDASPDEVARRLGPWDGGVPRHGMPWSDVMRVHGDVAAGEIREASDWARAPRVKNLRVVALRTDTGMVIRWGTNALVGRFLRHDDLVGYSGDDPTGVRSGYVDVQRDEMIVQGYREPHVG